MIVIEDIEAQNRRAAALTQVMGQYFVGQEPGVIGSVLADLMARLLANHKIPDDIEHQTRLREEILTTWCDTVRELVALYERQGEGLQ